MQRRCLSLMGLLLLAACSSSSGNKNVDEGGAAGIATNGGSDGGGTNGGAQSSGGSAVSAMGGHVSSGAGGSAQGGSDAKSGSGGMALAGASNGGAEAAGEGPTAGTPSGPTTCTGLSLSADTRPLYALPSDSTWSYAGSDESGSGAIVAIAVDRSVRLVSVDADAGMAELVNESDYKKNWSLDPTEVRAARAGSDVDALITDNAQMTLLRKRSATVEVSGLAHTNYLDLHALGVAHSSGLALFFQGDDSKTADETLSVVDLETQAATTRTFAGPASLTVVSDAISAWLAAERLDLSADCSSSSQMQTCSGGAAAVPIYNCTWHLDVWAASSSDALQGAPLLTLDVPATLSPNCGDSAPASLVTLPATLGRGAGFGAHHALAIDPTDNTLLIAVQRQLGTGNPGVQFEKLDAKGTRSITGVTAAVSTVNANSWLAGRAGRIFLCGGYNCAVADASAGKAFKLDQTLDLLDTRGVLLLPDGVGLIGGLSPSLQEVSCKP